MKTKDKSKHQSKTAPVQTASKGAWKRPLLLGLLVLVVGGGTWAILEFVVWNRIPSDLVGKWVVTEGSQEGATFDFFRNGTMVGKVNVRGKEGIINAKIRVEGKNIYSTTNHPQTGQEDTRVQVIRTLTAQQLVVEDEQGKLLKMERAE